MSMTFNVSSSALNAFRFPQLLGWQTRASRTKYRLNCGPDVPSCKQAVGLAQREAPLDDCRVREKCSSSHCVSLFLTLSALEASPRSWDSGISDRLSHVLGSEDAAQNRGCRHFSIRKWARTYSFDHWLACAPLSLPFGPSRLLHAERHDHSFLCLSHNGLRTTLPG